MQVPVAQAETLRDALASAYVNNPTLQAARRPASCDRRTGAPGPGRAAARCLGLR